MEELKRELPRDVKLVSFYDQSLFVRASAGSVWDAILFGLLLLAEIEHAVRAVAKRGYYSGTVTGSLMVLLGISPG